MIKLHAKDIKILQELDFNARKPVSQIAKKVGLSPEAVSYRIKQLEKNQIITGYYPVIDLSKLGYLFVRVVLQLEKLSEGIEEQFFRYLDTNPALGWVLIADNLRVVIVGYAKTVQEAKTLTDEITFAFNPHIKEKYLSIATKVYHFKRRYLYEESDMRNLSWGEAGEVDIDATDKKLLLLLTHHVQSTATDLAKQIGISPVAITKRIRKLENQKLIQGYRCSLNLQLLGFTHIKTFLYGFHLDKKRKTSLIEYIRQWKYTVYITEAFGKADLEFECHVPDSYILNDFVKKLCEEFPEIKSYETMMQYKEKIKRYIPEEI